MKELELLAPARNRDIGIAAIDCGADAVYIAAEQFGARQAAGNSVADIRELCAYAHRFGARIFVTVNTIIFENELEAAWRKILEIQDAGADAIIVQDMAVAAMASGAYGTGEGECGRLRIPLHASTQCSIRGADRAAALEKAGFSRLILEREMSLEQIRAIRDAVDTELEFFVHGALCVCYSGQCYLSEYISQTKDASRSANRGGCMQACRSRYDLVDGDGRVLVRDKALLSLKDYNLLKRLEELAEAGISSFKIEGRLKNESYVRNVVRAYSLALDELVARHPDRYCRASFGRVSKGFTPSLEKTFNRGYTELFIDGKRGGQAFRGPVADNSWAAVDAAKGMGERIGRIARADMRRGVIEVAPFRDSAALRLNNGDGFSFVSRKGDVVGFRADLCEGRLVRCKVPQEAFEGAVLFRNFDAAFEKELERQKCVREIGVSVLVQVGEKGLDVRATTEDGREFSGVFASDAEAASNVERMLSGIEAQLSKTTGIYRFSASVHLSEGCAVPFLPASFLNGIRRGIAEHFDNLPCRARPLANRTSSSREVHIAGPHSYKENIANSLAAGVYSSGEADAYELRHQKDAELMRTKYCIRHELGLCLKTCGGKGPKELFLVNNGRRLALSFDCRNCEMVVSAEPDMKTGRIF